MTNKQEQKDYALELALAAIEFFRDAVAQKRDGSEKIVAVSSVSENELLIGFTTLVSAFAQHPVFGGTEQAVDLIEAKLREYYS